jgi:hypothetical protein
VTFGKIWQFFSDESMQIEIKLPHIERLLSVETCFLSADFENKWSFCFKIWLSAQQRHGILGKNPQL